MLYGKQSKTTRRSLVGTERTAVGGLKGGEDALACGHDLNACCHIGAARLRSGLQPEKRCRRQRTWIPCNRAQWPAYSSKPDNPKCKRDAPRVRGDSSCVLMIRYSGHLHPLHDRPLTWSPKCFLPLMSVLKDLSPSLKLQRNPPR